MENMDSVEPLPALLTIVWTEKAEFIEPRIAVIQQFVSNIEKRCASNTSGFIEPYVSSGVLNSITFTIEFTSYYNALN